MLLKFEIKMSKSLQRLNRIEIAAGIDINLSSSLLTLFPLLFCIKLFSLNFLRYFFNRSFHPKLYNHAPFKTAVNFNILNKSFMEFLSKAII